MIAKLTGRLDTLLEDAVILDVGGVGYLVFCSGRTLGGLPGLGEQISLLIVTHVREDHIHLYGFGGEAEKAWFALLQTVQGVGARMALAVLGVFGPEELGLAIAAQDRTALQRTSGVGAKLATRIATELKDKAPSLIGLGQMPGVGSPAGERATVLSDAVSALIHLGYRPVEASGAVAHLARDLGDGAEVGDLVRGALRELAR